MRLPNQGLGSLASRSHDVLDEVTPIPGGVVLTGKPEVITDLSE
jgi:hypothetical protein